MLKKSLYGLKQSPRQGYKLFDTFMVGHGYTTSNYDSCVLHRKLSNGSFVYLLLFVDDMSLVAINMSKINSLKSQLSFQFEMKDLGAKRMLMNDIKKDT